MLETLGLLVARPIKYIFFPRCELIFPKILTTPLPETIARHNEVQNLELKFIKLNKLRDSVK